MNRVTFDQYYLDLLPGIAARATCIRRQVGCIIARDERIIAAGYNGPLPGVQHCTSDTCIRIVRGIPSGQSLELCVASHAEANAISQAARFGCSVENCTAYVSFSPCTTCTKLLISAGISRVVWQESYPDEFAMSFFINAGYSPIPLADNVSSVVKLRNARNLD